jgi:hypothetical protein
MILYQKINDISKVWMDFCCILQLYGMMYYMYKQHCVNNMCCVHYGLYALVIHLIMLHS